MVGYCELKVQVKIVFCCCECLCIAVSLLCGSWQEVRLVKAMKPFSSLFLKFVIKAGCKSENQASVHNRFFMSSVVWVCDPLPMGIRVPFYGI